MLNVFREWLNCFRVSAPMGRGVGRRRGRSRRPAVQSMIADIQILEPRTLLSASFPQFVDPHPSVGNGFGADVVPLKNGNVVVVAPGDNAGGTNAGAAYLFNGSTGALISSLRGSHDGDFTNCSIVAVGDSHFVIVNSDWENGIGAVTWGSGTAGVSGTIGASNSLIGSHVGDNIGAGGITVLANGNYLVDSYTWANGAMTDAGAVTFGNGATGIRGVVSSTNSLVGSSAHDEVGANFSNSWWGPDVFHPPMMLPVSSPLFIDSSIIWSNSSIVKLANGNYTVTSWRWNQSAGAVTFGNSSTGIVGVVSASNSLIGGSAGDQIGSGYLFGRLGVTPLANGNYVVNSPDWANGTATAAGAVTWGSGTTGIRGVVNASNSLVGSSANDAVGFDGIVELKTGNYVVNSSHWNNGSAMNAGAVTFVNGKNGITGIVSSANSLVGSTTNDRVGGTTEPFFVFSKLDAAAAGNVTSANNVTATSGPQANTVVSGVMPLVTPPSSARIELLANGDYLVLSQNWNNGIATDAGAVTYGSGKVGVKGTVSSANSLVGGSTGDEVGSGLVTAVGNESYVVLSPNWSNGSATDAGAVTFVRSLSGFKGVVSPRNSLVGSSTGDFVGSNGVKVLGNGNYLVLSPVWGAGAFESSPVTIFSSLGLGAVTWGSGKTGVIGAVNGVNSLVGSTSGDSVGSDVLPLSNGNYVVNTNHWNGGFGASTWGDGSKGVRGLISAANSLVSSWPGDTNNYSWTVPISNGNYLLVAPSWNHGAGAVTWVNGKTGIVGTISANNSLIGSAAGDRVGSSYRLLANGNYVINSENWNGNRGAVTWGRGTNGVVGVVSPSNSLVGGSADDQVGSVVEVLPNGNYVVESANWSNGAASQAGAVSFGNGATGTKGVVSSLNSLVGGKVNDRVGAFGIAILGNGNYIVSSPFWANGSATQAGAVTFASGTIGVHGLVTAANSLVGSHTNEQVGYGGIQPLANNNYLVISTFFAQLQGDVVNPPNSLVWSGAVTFGNGNTGVSGPMSNMNSFLGSGQTPDSLWNYFPQVTLDRVPQTFTVRFPAQAQVFVGSQVTGIPAPTLTLFAVDAAPLKYVRKSGSALIASTIQFANNSGDLTSATIAISDKYQPGQDLLEFLNTAKITGQWNAATGVLILSGKGTATEYAAALASVTYRNLSGTPVRQTRTVSFSISDGLHGSNTVTRKISFT